MYTQLRRVKPINLKFSFIQNDTYNYIQYRKTTEVLDILFVHYQGNVKQYISIKLTIYTNSAHSKFQMKIAC